MYLNYFKTFNAPTPLQSDYTYVGPLAYTTDKVNLDTNCFLDIPPFQVYRSEQGVALNRVDIDSDIKGIPYRNSKCPDFKFNPYRDGVNSCPNCENCNMGLPCGCTHCQTLKKMAYQSMCSKQTNRLAPIDSLLRKSCNVLSGVSTLNNVLDPRILTAGLECAQTLPDTRVIGGNARFYVKDILNKNSRGGHYICPPKMC